jgi:transposase
MARQKPQKQHPKRSDLELLNLNAAGLDIGAAEIYACVPSDRDEQPVRQFGTYTVDLHHLADWLAACGIETVAMESTGIYWIPAFEVLEMRGFAVSLVNARHLKQVPGRKSDVSDCEWLQQLHTYGLLRSSFRPDAEICALRALVRHRQGLIESRSQQIQLMQKALEQMNIKLTQVVSDITGVTGLSIIRALLQGERDPAQLAKLRNPLCQKSETEIAKALSGTYKSEHLFALRQSVEAFDFYHHQLQICDREIEAHYASLPPAPPGQGTSPPAADTQKRRKNQAHFDLAVSLYRTVGVDLTAIDGIHALTAQTLISEIGLDMSRWPTVKHFTSWLGLSPHNDISGGKVLRTRTKKTKNRANTALRLAAQSLHGSNSAVGGFYRRLRAKHGPAKATTATAHKLARIVYSMLRDRTPYQDPGAQHYEQHYQQRVLRNLQRKAQRLGMQLVPLENRPIKASSHLAPSLVS